MIIPVCEQRGCFNLAAAHSSTDCSSHSAGSYCETHQCHKCIRMSRMRLNDFPLGKNVIQQVRKACMDAIEQIRPVDCVENSGSYYQRGFETAKQDALVAIERCAIPALNASGTTPPPQSPPPPPVKKESKPRRFRDLALGSRFRYPGRAKVWILLSHHDCGLIAEYDEKLITDTRWPGQTVCSFADTVEMADELFVYLEEPGQ